MSEFDEKVRALLVAMAEERGVSARERRTLANAAIAATERAEAAEAEVEGLKGVLARLASSEAFYKARVMGPEDAELIARMDFARKALEAKP